MSDPNSYINNKRTTFSFIFANKKLWFFMDVIVGPQRKLSAVELMLLNCGVGDDSSESLGLQGNPTSPS